MKARHIKLIPVLLLLLPFTFINCAGETVENYLDFREESYKFTEGALTGRVFDAMTLAAIDAADVEIDGVVDTDIILPQNTLTDPTGEFYFAVLPGHDDFTLTVDKTGYNTGTKTSVEVIAGTDNDAGTVFLVPDSALPGNITGTVTDAEGGADLYGATVEIIKYDDTVAFSDTLVATNTFDSGALDPGSYTVRVTLDDYSDVVFNNQQINNNTIDLDVEMSSTLGSISGTLLDCFNDVIGPPDANINLTDGGALSVNINPDGSGNFLFDDLLPGSNYTITVNETGYDPSPLTVSDITVVAATDTPVSLFLVPDTASQGTITGTVVNADGGAAIIGASIVITKYDETIADTQTSDSNGEFTSTTLDPGDYTVSVTRAGYDPVELPPEEVNGGINDLGDIQMTNSAVNPGSISGTVENLALVAVSGATITLSDVGGDLESIESNGTGDFLFGSVPAGGPYTLTVVEDGYDTATVDDITVAASTPEDVGTIYLVDTGASPGVISGKVVNLVGGAAIIGANVEITKYDGTPADTQTSDSNGDFTSISLQAGVYTLTVTKTNYGTEIIEEVVVDGDNNLPDIAMTLTSATPGSIYGTVLDLDWIAVEGATIILSDSGGALESTTSDASGIYNFASVPEGTNIYSITIEKTGYNEATKNNISVTASTPTDVGTIFLVPTIGVSTGTFSGNVIDSYDGSDLGGATITIKDYQGNTVGDPIILGAGTSSFTSDTLNPGSYTVVVSKAGFFDFEVDNKIINGNKNLYSLAMCETLAIGALRLYVLWAESPNDLSLHLVGPTDNADTLQTDPVWDGLPNTRFHIHWWFDENPWRYKKQCYDEVTGEYGYTPADVAAATTAFVQDNTTGVGPETMNIAPGSDTGIYTFTIHNYSLTCNQDPDEDGGCEGPDPAWDSGAYMPIARIYDWRGLVREIPFPSTLPGAGDIFWKVCQINYQGIDRDSWTIETPPTINYLSGTHFDHLDKGIMDWSL